MKKAIIFALIFAGNLLYGDVLVYGPGGPAPVLKELANEFNKTSKEKINIIAGPTGEWIDRAKVDADMVYSGSSAMMDSFIKAMPEALGSEGIKVLSIREAGIIVRPNNPKNIKKLDDLFKSGIKVMVVDGAGQVGLYEDMALKDGKVENLASLRQNIVYYAKNSKDAVMKWNEDKTIDALIIWSHWAKSIGEDKAEFVSLKGSNVIFRATEIAITKMSQKSEIAQDFIDFITSKDAQNIWQKYGWEKR